MGVNRVPGVPFAQIANGALRDRRLSFKARGLLAMVLSQAGEWEATADWIEAQSNVDGKHSVQTALNELTEHGYRVVRKENLADGRVRTVVDWFHEPVIIRSSENPGVGFSGRRETGASLEHHRTEHYVEPLEVHVSVHVPLFDEFWNVYPRREAKATARKAWEKAVKRARGEEIIAGAVRYRDDPNRDAQFTAHPATWLNGDRWLDEALPQAGTRKSGTEMYYDLLTEVEGPRAIG